LVKTTTKGGLAFGYFELLILWNKWDKMDHIFQKLSTFTLVLLRKKKQNKQKNSQHNEIEQE
jgi:hypothetical protein